MTSTLAQDLGGVEAFCDAMEREHGYRPKLLPNGILLHGRDADRYEGWELAVHSAEIAGALRDAERYRHIRSANSNLEGLFSQGSNGSTEMYSDEYLDTTIDSAMQQGGGGGE
ncbi:MAG TPA: hypothetical protein VGE19_07410 [Pseudoxanthomonas sp.]